jgi:ubiquitin carboxyl-terminal hydrolase 5/13
MELEKTDKTMAELQLEINKSYDFSAITEAGAKLVPVKGPGFMQTHYLFDFLAL